MVVPEHDLVVWPFRTLSSADESQDVTSEEHLDDSNSSVKLYMVQSEISSFLIREGTPYVPI